MASLESRLDSSLRISNSSEDRLEQLMQENQELKRRIADLMSGGSAGTQIPFEELDVQDQVGGGGFSLVYRGFWKGTPVAIKKWFDPNLTDELMQEFREEVMTLAALRHPNVLQFLGASMKPPHLAMVTEHLPHSLHNVLYGGSAPLEKSRIISLAMDIARAFIYLHSRKPPVIHRDIKPANFLLDRAWKVKVCDFGLASNSRTQAGAGTPPYMAPELLDDKPYNEKVDVYAFGVLLNEMISRQPPHAGKGWVEVMQATLAGERPEIPLSCPAALTSIIQSCWSQEAASRPSFEKVLDMLKDVSKGMGASAQ